MKRFKTLIIVAGILSLAAPLALAQSPNPDQVYIKRITYAGPGCPSGSVAHNLSPDAKAFTLLFDSFFAEIGPDVPGGFAKNSCRITIDLRFPQGWSYTIFDVDYRGFASLDAGVTANQKSTYYFQSNPFDTSVFESTFYGPTDEDYLLTDSLGFSEMVYAPCGKHRALNIDTEISLENSGDPEGSGTITIDSIDGEAVHIYGIKWATCY